MDQRDLLRNNVKYSLILKEPTDIGSSGSEDAGVAARLIGPEANGSSVVNGTAREPMTMNANDSNPEKGPANGTMVHQTKERREDAPRHFVFSCLNVKTVDVISKFLAEVIGTGMLLMFGCSSGLAWTAPPPEFQCSLVFGLTVMLIIQCFGDISGAHLNPAVSLCALLHRTLSIPMFFVYVVAQLIGAFLGFGMLALLTPPHIFRPENSLVGSCSTVPVDGLGSIQVLAIEYFATTVLITLCCASWDPRNAHKQDSVALKFGFAVAALSISVGPATGCSMNPARTLGPAIWNNDWKMHWVYWVAPMLASVVTTFVYRCLFAEHPPVPKRVQHSASP